MEAKTILLGMNNPLSADPSHALYPYPPGCTGNRIYAMIRERVPGLTEDQYLEAFDRRNMLVGEDWNLTAARLAAPKIWESARGRRIIMLGAAVADAMRVRNRAPLYWHDHADVQYALVPHPSGRNRWYNEGDQRSAASRFLADAYLASAPVGAAG